MASGQTVTVCWYRVQIFLNCCRLSFEIIDPLNELPKPFSVEINRLPAATHGFTAMYK